MKKRSDLDKKFDQVCVRYFLKEYIHGSIGNRCRAVSRASDQGITKK